MIVFTGVLSDKCKITKAKKISKRDGFMFLIATVIASVIALIFGIKNNSIYYVLIILGDFCPQGNFLLLRYIHRAYQFIDNLYFLYSLSVYPLRSSNVNLIYKTIQNFGRQFLYIGITLYQ